MAKKSEDVVKYKRIMQKLSKKYGMNFINFEKNLGKKFSLNWEHEKDYIDWDWALANIRK